MTESNYIQEDKFVKKSEGERKALLEKAITEYLSQGWTVNYRSDFSAQLVKETPADGCTACLLALILILPAILYLIFYKGKTYMTIEVDEYGTILTQKQPNPPPVI